MKCKLYLNKCFTLLAALLLASTLSQAQSVTVTGTVTDVAGQPLIGVAVTVQGTSTGVTTDAQGKYSIKVPNAQAVLNFNYLGYVDQTQTVGAKRVIDVTMEEDAQTMEDIVVIGYGTVKRRDLTGSVASVGGDDISAMPIANAAQALQGKIAGVTIMSVDGRPDADVKIRVRGGGSITQSNDPLYIVDGFPVNGISDIPGSQIESIDILKDASSTAIYGARGANGVVIVTTKSPKGDKLSITYDGYVQWKTPTDMIETLNPYDFAMINWEYTTLNGTNTGFEKAFAVGSTYKDYVASSGIRYNNPEGINAYKHLKGVDWMEELTRTAFSHSHNLGISGGNDKTKFSLNFNYVDDEGLKIQSGYTRANIMAKLQQKLAKGLTLDVDARYSDIDVMGKNDGSRLSDIIRFTPLQVLGDTDETSNTDLGLDGSNLYWRNNPVDVVNDIYQKTMRNSIRGNVALSWEIIKGLTFRTEFGASKNWNQTRWYEGPVAKDTQGKMGGDASISKSEGTRFRFTNTLTYQVEGLGKDHSLNVLLGQEISGDDSKSTKQEGKDFPISFDYERVFVMMSQYNNQTTTSISSSSMDDPDRLASFFGRINYIFKDRYLLTATFRADGSSNFSPENRWGYFPAAAAAWRISSEPFMKNASDWLDNLKLRVSYGETGNDRINSGLWKAEWKASGSGYSINNTLNSYYAPASNMMTNPKLKWETTITRNLGLDFGFFNNRLYGTIDAYWNTTKDLLLVNSLPAFTGYTEQMDNVGQTRNRGIEVSLGGDIVRNKDWRVSANFNIGFNKSRIEKLSEGMDYKRYSSGIGTSSAAPVNDFEFRVGGQVGMIRGYVADGFYTTKDFNYDPATQKYTLIDGVPNSLPILSAVPGMTGAYPGMMKLKKMGSENSATEINEADDCVIIGNTNPKHTGGLTLNASWKNLDLMLSFNWSYGNDVYNYTKCLNSTGGKSYNRNFIADFANRYRLFDLDNNGNLARVTDPAQLDALNANATTYYPFHEFRVLTSEFIEDGSFLRLNNITLGYTLPQKWTRKVAIQKLRIYATVYNAWLWTNYSGMDPEVDSGSGRNSTYPTPGMDYGTYPRPRTYTLGINLTF